MNDDNYGFTEEEILEISEYDEEWGHLTTTKHPVSKTSQELLEIIHRDANREECKQRLQSSQMFYCLIIAVIAFVFFIALRIIGQLPIGGDAEFIIMMLLFPAVIFCQFIFCYYLEGRADSVIANDQAIGWKKYGVAIEWNHIVWIDIGIKEKKIKYIAFSGNRRNLFHDNDFLHGKFTFTHLRKYLPDFNQWISKSLPGWPKNYTRYVRPTEDNLRQD